MLNSSPPRSVDIEFAYYDAKKKKLVDEWDSAEQGGLPRAVEITLELAAEPRSLEKESEQLDDEKFDSDEEKNVRVQSLRTLAQRATTRKAARPSKSTRSGRDTEQTL